MSRYPLFDRSRLRLRGLAERGHLLSHGDCLPLAAPAEPFAHPDLPALAEAIRDARRRDRPVLLMIGAHPVKLGLSRFLIDLIERRLVTHLATNGAGLIHDFELALAGGTSEDVGRWVAAGQFGLWQETGRLNDVSRQAAERGEGLGEAVGRTIEEERFAHRDLSVAAAGWRTGTPVTAHVGIGSDIHHGLANCDGAALGQASYTDFLIFARAVEGLEGGVFVNVGSVVTGPEVDLKALAMARNVAHQEGRSIRRFTTAVFDVVELPADFCAGPPPPGDALNYYRPWKTILVRTVADGGTSYYVRGDHRRTIPPLWHRLVTRAGAR
ncbi:MAG TPA: hypothetical protein VKA46_27425 [Gemmataceae bacterium]|nr:hypothetical protein [Gemmataceae bacterium]